MTKHGFNYYWSSLFKLLVSNEKVSGLLISEYQQYFIGIDSNISYCFIKRNFVMEDPVASVYFELSLSEIFSLIQT